MHPDAHTHGFIVQKVCEGCGHRESAAGALLSVEDLAALRQELKWVHMFPVQCRERMLAILDRAKI